MFLWLQILSYQLPAGSWRRYGPAFLVSLLFFLSLPSPLSSFLILHCPHLSISLSVFLFLSISFCTSFHLSSTYFPLGLILQFPALFFPSFLSFSLSLVLCKGHFHVTLIGNTAVSHNVTRSPGCRTKTCFKSLSLKRENLIFKICVIHQGWYIVLISGK